MCIEGFDPCQDDLGSLRMQASINHKKRLRPFTFCPSPEPLSQLIPTPAKREKLPAEMPPHVEDPYFFEHIP
jgi:hypothetical protein